MRQGSEDLLFCASSFGYQPSWRPCLSHLPGSAHCRAGRRGGVGWGQQLEAQKGHC